MNLLRTPLSIVIAFLVVFLMFFPMTARAQSAPARDYLNTPVNQARFFSLSWAQVEKPQPNPRGFLASPSFAFS
jgi:hypothetical protein